MSDETWRPLGVDTEDAVAEYDALHDGVPEWMTAAFWAWVRPALMARRRGPSVYGQAYYAHMLDTDLAEQMCQALRIPLPNLRKDSVDSGIGKNQLAAAISVLVKHHAPLQIADYLLAHGGHAQAGELDSLLARSKSAWEVGSRHGKPGLVRRVPQGVQEAADSVMARAGRAGARLAKAWGELYGLTPDPSVAYGLAVKAVEDAAIPVVSPTNERATLGTVLAQIEQQGDWGLPMEREHDRAPSREVLISMMRMLWHGQHDRHGGQPAAPGDVSIEEATVAVSLAVTLVNLFDADVVARPRPAVAR
ncbi:MAG TPA: hypothetical protein VF557_13155 [Jatrophihabitans sp.]|uniref:hypothetical protein n=1 Tax=Jatrophihabitans sp. TaxID=1932789 RepID=UPI002EE0D385